MKTGSVAVEYSPETEVFPKKTGYVGGPFEKAAGSYIHANQNPAATFPQEQDLLLEQEMPDSDAWMESYVHEQQNDKPDPSICTGCNKPKPQCICRTEEEPDSPEETSEESAEHLTLDAGETSLFDRVTNLINDGRPDVAIAHLEAALNGASEETIGAIAHTAIHARNMMDHYGYEKQSGVLTGILSDWGMGWDMARSEHSMAMSAPGENPSGHTVAAVAPASPSVAAPSAPAPAPSAPGGDGGDGSSG